MHLPSAFGFLDVVSKIRPLRGAPTRPGPACLVPSGSGAEPSLGLVQVTSGRPVAPNGRVFRGELGAEEVEPIGRRWKNTVGPWGGTGGKAGLVPQALDPDFARRHERFKGAVLRCLSRCTG